jgi:glutamate/tyrosine decarboxylase-like PLP-dependent enzyme
VRSEEPSGNHLPELNLDRLQEQLFEILRDFYGASGSASLVQHETRERLHREFHRETPPRQGRGMEAALLDFKDRVLPRSIRTWHPLFLNHTFAGAPVEAVIGDCLASMLNTTLATWETSPAATVIERNVSEWMAGLLGMPAGSAGIFLPGGSMANFCALALARDTRLAGAKSRGLYDAPRGAILCSEAAHYSVMNAARLLGIGDRGVVAVRTSGPRLEMDPSGFEAALAHCRGVERRPFALVLTAGLVLTGGVDPLEPLVRLGHAHGLHVHVDAAFGGTLALTNRARLLEGIGGADSVTWDAHKWMNMPLPCSVLLVPDARALRKTFENSSSYLFHGSGDSERAEDLGRFTPLCGKRFDALKLWLVWNAWGTATLRRLAQSRLDLAGRVHRMLSRAADFRPAYEPVTPTLCFRHIPNWLAGAPAAAADAMHRWVREQLRAQGRAFINIAALNGAEHFRVVLVNPLTTIASLEQLLGQIRRLAARYHAAVQGLPRRGRSSNLPATGV